MHHFSTPKLRKLEKLTAAQGFTLVEMVISLVMSGIVMAGIYVIVSGSHTYVLKERNKTRLQQDFSLIDQLLGKQIGEALYGEHRIYTSYADYTGSGTPQASGTCVKLYYPAGDSVIIYEEGSSLKIQQADLSIMNLVPSVLDSVLFTSGTQSISTYLNLLQDGKAVSQTLVHSFRNLGKVSILDADFDSDEDGFSYSDDKFRSTSEPSYASGTRIASGGYSGGALKVDLGGINESDITDMSGGWQRSFTLTADLQVTLSLRYKLTMTQDYESNEFGEVLISLNGTLYGTTPNDYVEQLVGNGNGGGSETTGWQQFSVNFGTLTIGSYDLAIGGYNNQKTTTSESTEILIDDVKVE